MANVNLAVNSSQYDGRNIHSISIATETVRLVQRGEANFFAQYMLNPSLDIKDVQFVIGIAVSLIVLRFILSGANNAKFHGFSSIFSKIFRNYLKPKKERKMSENLWYTFWHTWSLCFGIYVLYTEASTAENPGWVRLLIKNKEFYWYWFPTKSEYLAGNPGWPLFPVSEIMRVYYLSELGFWLSCLVFLWAETIRSDFYVFFLHHIVTCVLICFSYTCSFWRIGIIILVLHDSADVLLYSAKALSYSKAPSAIVDGTFILFVITFFITRLAIFPYACVIPSLAYKQHVTQEMQAMHKYIPGGVSLPWCLCILQVLHIFWFWLILKMIKKIFFQPKASETFDIRSDDEKDSNENPDCEDSGNEASLIRYEDTSEGTTQRIRGNILGGRATTGRRNLKPLLEERKTLR